MPFLEKVLDILPAMRIGLPVGFPQPEGRSRTLGVSAAVRLDVYHLPLGCLQRRN